MIINLVPDASVASAPAGFVQAMQQAALILGNLIADNITINIAYGWGTYNNQPMAQLDDANLAVGGYINGRFETYATAKSLLAGSATSALDLSTIAALPANDTVFPNAHNLFVVTTAQEKAFGSFTGDPSALDGAIGFGTDTDAAFWRDAAVHEMTHAMGRISGYTGKAYSDLLDLFRFSAPATYQWIGGQPAYFTLDNGVTDLANFSTVLDYGDLANDDLTPADDFGAIITPSALSPVDLKFLDAIGFDIGPKLTVGDGQSQTVSGARLTGAIAGDGGTLRVVSGGATRMTTVEAGGTEIVSSGGRASGTVVSSGGGQTISGGMASGTGILNGATVQALRGGTISAADVGGMLVVSAGGTAVAATVSSGGTLSVRAGGASHNTILLSGAQETVRAQQGVARGTVIGDGAAQTVSAGGVAIGARVAAGGAQHVARGGTASGTTISGGGTAFVSAGGIVRGAVVESGGTLFAGGSARNATIQSGGTIVFGGGTVAGLVTSSGALEEIAAGAAVSALTVSAGVTLTVSSHRTATGIHVLSGGELVYAGGAVRNARIDSGGHATVAAGVTVVSLTVGNGAILEVASGATARAITLAGGTEIVSSGGKISAPVTFAGNAGLVLADANGMAPKLSGFAATDRLDLADFGFPGAEHMSFVEFPGRKRGVLTVTDGALAVSITLFGQYSAQGFHLADDGQGGTLVTYADPAQARPLTGDLAAIGGHVHAD